MKDYTINLQRAANMLIIICILTYILIVAKSILIPVFFGAAFAFLLKPLSNKIAQFVKQPVLAILLTFFIALLPVFIIVLIFSMQFIEVVSELPSIKESLNNGLNQFLIWFSKQFGLSRNGGEEWITNNMSGLIEAPISFIQSSISSSTAFISGLLLTILYTFLMLLYKSSFKRFFLIQFPKDKKDNASVLLEKIQKVIQSYLYGTGIVMLFLGCLNTAGLYLIGIEYAPFWGFLAALLAIIPYIGTFLGGFLPFMFTLATTGNLAQPMLVILLFGTVQFLEGNIITPKIVGSSVKINPLAAMLALVIGGTMWGISGLILALPLLAVLKVIMAQINFLKPVSLLLSSDLYGNEEVFEEKFDKERFRFWNFFKREKRI